MLAVPSSEHLHYEANSKLRMTAETESLYNLLTQKQFSELYDCSSLWQFFFSILFSFLFLTFAEKLNHPSAWMSVTNSDD